MPTPQPLLHDLDLSAGVDTPGGTVYFKYGCPSVKMVCHARHKRCAAPGPPPPPPLPPGHFESPANVEITCQVDTDGSICIAGQVPTRCLMLLQHLKFIPFRVSQEIAPHVIAAGCLRQRLRTR